MISIELTGEPKGKGRPRFVRATGHTYTPESTRTYENVLRFTAQQEMNGAAPIADACVVTMEARFAVPASWSKKKRALALSGELRPVTKPDADNLLKTLDALNGVVFVDDKQIVEATIRKIYSEQPGVTVTVATVVINA